MKKILLFFALFLLSFHIYSQNSEPKREIFYWLGVGANYSTMLFEEDRYISDVSSRVGINFGSTIRVHFLNTPFELDFGVLYSRKGAVTDEKQVLVDGYSDYFDYSKRITTNYLDFPILANISTNSTKKAQLYCGAGFQISWGLKGKIYEVWKNNDTKIEETTNLIFDDTPEANLHKADISYKFQVGLRKKSNYDICASYTKSLVNIDPNAKSIKNSYYSLSFLIYLSKKYSGR